jgi:hypothetical protein
MIAAHTTRGQWLQVSHLCSTCPYFCEQQAWLGGMSHLLACPSSRSPHKQTDSELGCHATAAISAPWPICEGGFGLFDLALEVLAFNKVWDLVIVVISTFLLFAASAALLLLHALVALGETSEGGKRIGS